MATLTKGKTFTNGELVTPQKLHELVDLGSVANIVNADIAANAAIADTKLATISTANKVANSATTATNASTANAIVARDGSSNFSAGTITANLTGNASTATTLQTARTINGVSFNGSANITVTATPNEHTHGSITNLGAIGTAANLPIITGASGVLQAGSFGTTDNTFCKGNDSRLSDARTPTDGSVTNAKVSASAAIADTKLATITTAGKVSNSATTATNANTANAIVARDASGNFSAGTITASLTGTASGNAPSNHTHGSITNLGAIGTAANLPIITGTSGVLQAGSFGTTDNTFCKGNDSRLSDARTPTDGSVTTAKIADGAVTQAKLNSSVTLVPTGAVMPFAMNSAPSGWLAANGNEYSKTGTYAALFAVIGTIYGETNGTGGTGTTHFRVPDLRGYFVRGAGTNSDGTASGTFGAKQSDAFQGHYHNLTSDAQYTGYGSSIASGGTWAGFGASIGVTSPKTDGTNGTPRTASETRPANIALLYCIKF